MCAYIYPCMYFCYTFLIVPRAEEMWVKIITTAKFSDKFSLSPRNFQRSFHGIAQNFKYIFHGIKRKYPSLKRLDRKIVQSGDKNVLSPIFCLSDVCIYKLWGWIDFESITYLYVWIYTHICVHICEHI